MLTNNQTVWKTNTLKKTCTEEKEAMKLSPNKNESRHELNLAK